MATREELYRKFGPQLIEALAKVVLDEVNALRSNAGLAERTGQQLIDALAGKLEDTPQYDWMNEA